MIDRMSGGRQPRAALAVMLIVILEVTPLFAVGMGVKFLETRPRLDMVPRP
jgi:hypothetical protein